MIGSLPANAATMFLPEFFDPRKKDLNDLFVWQESISGASIVDLFELQKKELIKIKSPQKPLSSFQIDELYFNWSKDKEPSLEGVWVYYPWLNKVLHILEKEEFIALRTNRNFYKITPKEQQELSTKTIGIVGLSVGHAVAVTLATERVCGKMRLADFDSLELSNLNRIKTGLQNLGINKTIITAREIAEIDPFIEIECFQEGITKNNIDDFLLRGGKLDILVDECDSIDIKILIRHKAKANRIPVVMETSDRGMLDVERFDLEEERPVLHGLLEGMPTAGLENLTSEQKIPLVLKVADFNKGSLRGKISMLEVGHSISTWPQLASAVTLGGAVATDVCRRILLHKYHESGRYYIDLEELISNKINQHFKQPVPNPHPAFDAQSALIRIKTIGKGEAISETDLRAIINAACQAPSNGNDQPWKFIYDNNALHLFHDRHRSHSFSNSGNLAAYLAFGAAFENLLLQSNSLGLHISWLPHFEAENENLVGSIHFSSKPTDNSIAVAAPELAEYIYKRHTNRGAAVEAPINDDLLSRLSDLGESIENTKLNWITSREQMLEIAKIIGECDRFSLLHPQGHADFFQRDIRWTPEQMQTGDGIGLGSLGLAGPAAALLGIMRDPTIAAELNNLDLGTALARLSMATAMQASAIGIITVPEHKAENYFKAGMCMQRVWLQAEQMGYSIHPLNSPVFLFARLVHSHPDMLNGNEKIKLEELRKRFQKIARFTETNAEVFLFRIFKPANSAIATMRLPQESTYTSKHIN